MKGTILFFCCSLFLLVFNFSNAQLPAFPGAEGAGKFTTGGRGTVTTMTTVFEVTNLTDVNSPGSLRYACSQSTTTHPFRTIVFKVSGTIRLNSRLNIPRNTTIAGQTAPGEGICIADHPVVINGDNVIIRYIRFRLGDRNQLKTTPANCGLPVAPFNASCMPLDGSGGDDALGNLGNKNIIIDHCSVSWSADEALTIYRGDSVTVQWSFITEPLNYNYHFEAGGTDFQQHGYGGIWGGINASFHHNLIAHCRNRTPRFAGNSSYPAGVIEKADFRNNVIYNWGINNVYGGEGGNYNLVNNYYKFGPNTSSGVRFRVVGVDSAPTFGYAKYFLLGNYVDGSATVTNNNWLGAGMNTGNTADTVKSKVTTPFLTNFIPAVTQTALEAYDTVLNSAGCTIPARDTLDMRIVSNVRNRTGRIIDVQGGYPHGTPFTQTVNAWPNLLSTTAPIDTDQDGMPNTWELANGLNPNSASDRGLFAVNGYTNLENYLNNIQSTTVVSNPTNTANAIWTLLSNQSATIMGSIAAPDQLLGSALTGIQYNSTFGGVSGWQRVGSTSGLPIGAYDANAYVEYKLSPTSGKFFTATSIELAALGGGTSTARMAIYYSLDNFVTSFPAGTCTYNNSTFDGTITNPVVLLNTSTTSLTGQQIAVIPTSITVNPTQTLSVRIYVWITGTGTRYFTSQNVTINGFESTTSLPSSIINFSANTLNKHTKLTWSVVNEKNVEKYVVEASADGFNFFAIGEKEAFNTGNGVYTLNDYSPLLNDVTYYRIKIVDRDGSFKLSFIIQIKNRINTDLLVYPNPAISQVTINYALIASKAEAMVYSATGARVMNIQLLPHTTQATFSVEHLPKGVYYITLVTNKQHQKVKLVKQ